MSIVFVDPPSPPGFVAFRDSHGGYGECCRTSRLKFPALDLFHSASLLLDHGIEAAIVDSVLMDHSPAACVGEILKKKPSLVVFRTSSGSCPHDLQVARRLKASFSGPVVFYGPQAAMEPDHILSSPAVDAVVVGEAAPTFLAIARAGGLAGVPGVWHKRSGRLVKTPPAPRLEDLDKLPIPRWDLVDYRRYSYVTTRTSWGCPLGCGYCPYPVTQGARWRTRSAASVVREFRALRERYGLRFVLLRDPIFSLRKDRTAALCRALGEAGSPLLWGCETRLDTLDAELMDLLARAGCIRVAFGVDSVNNATLKLMGRRGGTPDAIRTKVRDLKRRGILTYAMYIIGLPGETPESTGRLIDFALELDTDAAAFSMATPFAGTALAELGSERGFIRAQDPIHLTSCLPSMRNESMSMAEIEALYRSAKEKWQNRKAKRSARP